MVYMDMDSSKLPASAFNDTYLVRATATITVPRPRL
jgi:hypothetical protein